jgi:hypothetical protein
MIEIRDTLSNRLSIQPNGSSCAIRIEGDETQIQEAFDTLYNHGATKNPEMEKGQGYAFFWSSPAKLKSALLSIFENRLLNREKVTRAFKGHKQGIRPLAKKIVEAKVKTLPTVRFLTQADMLVKECAPQWV